MQTRHMSRWTTSGATNVPMETPLGWNIFSILNTKSLIIISRKNFQNNIAYMHASNWNFKWKKKRSIDNKYHNNYWYLIPTLVGGAGANKAGGDPWRATWVAPPSSTGTATRTAAGSASTLGCGSSTVFRWSLGLLMLVGALAKPRIMGIRLLEKMIYDYKLKGSFEIRIKRFRLIYKCL